MFCFLILKIFPVFTNYSILFPSYSRRDVESPLGSTGFKGKSGKIKENRPLPSKWASAVASAKVADWLLGEKLGWFAKSCRQIGYVVWRACEASFLGLANPSSSRWHSYLISPWDVPKSHRGCLQPVKDLLVLISVHYCLFQLYTKNSNPSISFL